MTAQRPRLDQLERIHELNRMFLGFVQTRARQGGDCLGLPADMRPLLAAASGSTLAAIAEFPRALFDLRLPDTPPAARDLLAARDDPARYALYLTIALCAWTLSRESAYQARLTLALRAREIQRLRGLELAELQRLAHAQELVRCAFAERDWLWRELLTEPPPEARQRLALVALQPGLDADWPARRLHRPA